MIIAVWGRDGIGKSTFCDSLGLLFTNRGCATVIDTDLTQPTLPVRLNGLRFDSDTSLGRAVLGYSRDDATPFLHQHPKRKGLFYAGLVDGDDYMTFETVLNYGNVAEDFVERCEELSGTVILDLSGQRNDPFLPGALMHSDMLIVLFTPDVQGVCWFNSVEPLLHNMKAQERVLAVAAMEDKHHDLPTIEKITDVKFTAALPFVKEFRQTCGTGVSPLDGATPAAICYQRRVRRLFDRLKEARK
jgi:MinD-like ATPase involved in chromosome partitioning or flagellar assembly